jgi:hypothetical protein
MFIGLDISSFFILNSILLKKYDICGLLKGKVACDSAVAGVPATALAVVLGNVHCYPFLVS